jgi:hypothetical protein
MLNRFLGTDRKMAAGISTFVGLAKEWLLKD